MDGIFTIARDLNLVTVYAAFVSTVVLVWQIFTYMREGALLRARASPNMKFITPGQGTSDKTYVMLTVVNVGSADTTITGTYLQGYENWWQRLRNRPGYNAVVVATPGEVPAGLKVGGQFTTMSIQNDELERLSRDTALFIGVAHSFSTKMTMARIRPIAPKAEEKPMHRIEGVR